MKIIQLNRGYECRVSDEDYDKVKVYRWRVNFSGSGAGPYAVTDISWKDENGKKHRRKLLMHRFLTNAPPTVHVDHEDRDGLNNQRNNMRFSSPLQNLANRFWENLLGYKGVSKSKKKFRARIMLNGERRCLGYYDTPEEAARAYDKALHDAFGVFGWFNFPDEYPRGNSDEHRPVYDDAIPF